MLFCNKIAADYVFYNLANCAYANHLLPHIMQLFSRVRDIQFEVGRVAQSVTCLVTDVNLTADPGICCSC